MVAAFWIESVRVLRLVTIFTCDILENRTKEKETITFYSAFCPDGGANSYRGIFSHSEKWDIYSFQPVESFLLCENYIIYGIPAGNKDVLEYHNYNSKDEIVYSYFLKYWGFVL
jgi:hypothetical protein